MTNINLLNINLFKIFICITIISCYNNQTITDIFLGKEIKGELHLDESHVYFSLKIPTGNNNNNENMINDNNINNINEKNDLINLEEKEQKKPKRKHLKNISDKTDISEENKKYEFKKILENIYLNNISKKITKNKSSCFIKILKSIDLFI